MRIRTLMGFLEIAFSFSRKSNRPNKAKFHHQVTHV
ncbi:unnamed protein product [Larinioides sclopetarius]|uniref:Uncharacterized protein n=1 Tax=Larinioides sclopetarius TaxID=280406 RepID=A0AAV2B9L3_9ARAC